MNYDDEALLLRYEARGLSGCSPVLQLLILKAGNGVFYRTAGTRRDKDGPDHFIKAGDAAMAAVRQILAEERLYAPGKPESPKEDWGGIHIYDFYFRTEGRSAHYTGAQLEYAVGRKEFPKTNYLFDVMKRLGRILIPEGVPAECFAPAKKTMVSPVIHVPAPVRTFTVFDLWKSGGARLIDKPPAGRLERYAFEERNDGSFTLTVQAGWPGSRGHWDGAGNSFALPAEWFKGSYRGFLEKLTEKYPAASYGFSKEELAGTPGLGKFLGFPEDEEGQP